MNKVLLGVAHESEEELDRVKNILGQYSPSKAGIELPEDYLEKKMRGIVTLFFDDIVSYFKDAGVDVLPLENSDAYNFHQAIEVAKAVRDGRAQKEDIETALANFAERISSFSAPEVLYQCDFFIRRYQTALEILESAPTLEEVIKLWEESNAKREAYVLQKIKMNRPDIAIIGNGHAKKLKHSLSEYT